MSRRSFLTALPGLAATLLVKPVSSQTPARPRRPKRVLVVGAGFAGTMVAVTLRKLAPEAEVMVIEKGPVFIWALGLRLVEMGRNRAESFCCGAGGGRIWMGDTRAPGVPTPTEQRIHEALEIPGVRYFVVACPKDVTMYRDAVKTAGQEGKIAVRDLVELLEEALSSEGDVSAPRLPAPAAWVRG